MAFDLERIDYADCILLAVPPGSTATATEWVDEMFSTSAMPRWVALAMGLRQRLVRLIGLDPSPPDAFRVTTAVQLHGLRGRVYFLPVRLVHPTVVAAMLRATLRRLT